MLSFKTYFEEIRQNFSIYDELCLKIPGKLDDIRIYQSILLHLHANNFFIIWDRIKI